jgi:hypothetical protein
LRFGALGVQFSLFVIYRWFGAYCFILFDLALQGWGPMMAVGYFFFLFFWVIIVFWGHFMVFSSRTHEST